MIKWAGNGIRCQGVSQAAGHTGTEEQRMPEKFGVRIGYAV